MAAISTVLQSLAPGSHVISVSDVYGGTYRYLTQFAPGHGVTATFTLDVESNFHTLKTPNTKLIWIETPSNPTLRVANIAAIAEAAHHVGIQVVVDNTLLSPYIQNPLKHGADIVVHSVSKYINGHSDVLMGAVVFNDPELYPRLQLLQKGVGAVPSPFDCWLARRGMKTLHLRAHAASFNASAIAAILQSSPHVLKLNYPGLESHPNHKAVLQQHRDGMGGGMLSFRIKGGSKAAAAFCQNTRLFTLAVSLGGVESLVEVPSLMTHAGIPMAHRHMDEMFDDLVRLSCGIESSIDLCNDVVQALDKAAIIRDQVGETASDGKETLQSNDY